MIEERKDLIDKEQKFDPSFFGLEKLEKYSSHNEFDIWVYKAIEIVIFKNGVCQIKIKGDYEKEKGKLYFDTNIYLGYIPNQIFAKELFKNLVLIEK